MLWEAVRTGIADAKPSGRRARDAPSQSPLLNRPIEALALAPGLSAASQDIPVEHFARGPLPGRPVRAPTPHAWSCAAIP
ncbi:hypothetical protein GCM10022214_51990 [Actinomadura miaoliensis]|uniref:Uncharacterized protein n=1 Tax=Actinomadura miaoliensis TaxID=430685 RepID=A0ABP7WBY1_9ACTN